MGQHLLPSRMSLPEVMGDACASELRDHSLALLRATTSADRLIRSHPDVAHDLDRLRDSIERYTSSVLNTLADEAGLPAEGESISPVRGPQGDYRIDRGSGCWIWMRSVTDRGYPIIGRKANGRENVPAKIYWMLAHGPLDEDAIVVRTCDLRLCVNPAHGRVTDRRTHGAERMREESAFDWEMVREIRAALCSSRDRLRELASEFATQLEVSEHSVIEIFRNKVWVDPAYDPGFEVTCAGPDCDVVFRTTSTVRKYHSKECHSAAALARSYASPRSNDVTPPMSAARRAREDAALRAEAAAAEAEWSDALEDRPRTSVWSVASIDQPIGDGGRVLHDVLATSDGEGDPAFEIERKAERDVLRGLTEDAIAEMDEAELARLRANLAAADLRPSTSSAIAG